jgi:hypothetical protein
MFRPHTAISIVIEYSPPEVVALRATSGGEYSITIEMAV